VCMHPEDNQSHIRKQKIRIKSQKSDFKVIRDMLTKKWIFVKKNQQLGSLPEVTSLLRALGLLR
jgi:hypothetical protein